MPPTPGAATPLPIPPSRDSLREPGRQLLPPVLMKPDMSAVSSSHLPRSRLLSRSSSPPAASMSWCRCPICVSQACSSCHETPYCVHSSSSWCVPSSSPSRSSGSSAVLRCWPPSFGCCCCCFVSSERREKLLWFAPRNVPLWPSPKLVVLAFLRKVERDQLEPSYCEYCRVRYAAAPSSVSSIRSSSSCCRAASATVAGSMTVAVVLRFQVRAGREPVARGRRTPSRFVGEPTAKADELAVRGSVIADDCSDWQLGSRVRRPLISRRCCATSSGTASSASFSARSRAKEVLLGESASSSLARLVALLLFETGAQSTGSDEPSAGSL